MNWWDSLLGRPPVEIVEVVDSNNSDSVLNPISIKMEPEDRPEFKRIYKVKLDNRAQLEIDMKTYTFTASRSSHATLTQPNGNSVWFDPDRIADKILDPLLVPILETYVREIKRLDKEFIATNPQQFTDDQGVVWERKS